MATKKAAAKKGGQKAASESGQSSEAKFKVGDRVRWGSSGGQAEGKIVKVAKADGRIKGFEYKASKDDPRYIVETDEGQRAAHKAGELKKA